MGQNQSPLRNASLHLRFIAIPSVFVKHSFPLTGCLHSLEGYSRSIWKLSGRGQGDNEDKDEFLDGVEDIILIGDTRPVLTSSGTVALLRKT